MGMYDWYRPKEKAACPECGSPLTEWQGKDGPRFLYVWVEGVPHPIDQCAEDEWKVPLEVRRRERLPSSFIYSYDCERHAPISAECQTTDQVWTTTRVLPFQVVP